LKARVYVSDYPELKYISDNVASKLIGNRPFNSYAELEDFVAKRARE